MPGRLRLIVVALLLATSAVSVTPTYAEQKAPQLSVKDKQGICDFRWLTCLNGCDQLIDLGSAVSTCQRRCDRRHNTCLKRAQTLEVPEVGTDNGMSTPNLTVAP